MAENDLNESSTPATNTPVGSRSSHPLKRLMLLILASYLSLLAPLTYFQRSLIYHPVRSDRLFADQSGLPQPTTDVTVKSYDGLDLHGWLALAGTSASDDPPNVDQVVSNSRPVILYFPGNAFNRSGRWTQLVAFGSLDAHAILVDYRGYGDNSGQPSEENFARDARSVWNYLTQELNVSPHRIIIYGESLGGGVATRLTSELCQEGVEPGGLVIQSTFNSLVAVAQYHVRFVPVSLILVDRYPSNVRIRQVTCPILQIHGTDDSVVPFELGQRLFDVAPAKSSNGRSKRQVLLMKTNHNDVYFGAEKPKVLTELKQFIEEVADVSEPRSDQQVRQSNPVQTTKRGKDRVESIDWITMISAVTALAALVAIWKVLSNP